MIEISLEDLSEHLALLRPDRKKNYRNYYPVPTNILKEFLADLSSLELVRPSPKKHLAKDTKDYWTISEKGRDVYSYIRRKRLEEGIHDLIKPADEVSEKKAKNNN